MNESKEIRLLLGFTQEEMAKVCNTSIGTVTKWEQDQRQPRGQAVRLLEILVLLKTDHPGIFKKVTTKYL